MVERGGGDDVPASASSSSSLSFELSRVLRFCLKKEDNTIELVQARKEKNNLNHLLQC